MSLVFKQIVAAVIGAAIPWLFWLNAVFLDKAGYSNAGGFLFYIYLLLAFPWVWPAVVFWPSIFFAHLGVAIYRLKSEFPLMPVFYSFLSFAILSVVIQIGYNKFHN